MTEKIDNSAGIDECQHVTYHLPKWDEKGKCSWDNIQLQHKSLNAKAICIKPPTKVIPVIFIPGIMGTNLMLDDSSKKSIWRGDNLAAVAWKWISMDGNNRRLLLNPSTTIVDDRGDIYQNNYSLFSDDGKLFPKRFDRHWGKAVFFSYGQFLNVFQSALMDDWQKDIWKAVLGPSGEEGLKYTTGKEGILSNLVGDKLDATNESTLTPKELAHFKNFLFPVHVFGYNWLQDNKISAKELDTYITDVFTTYKQKHGYGLAFPEGEEKVIIVTHSMGGLIARYASQVDGLENKILGIVHGVIPDLGSPAAYRRMKTGAGEEGIAGKVLGETAEELMSVLASAPAPLQLLPSANYMNGAPWLTIPGVGSLPQKNPETGLVDPFSDIYLKKDFWWQLYQPDILDKDTLTIENNWKSYNSSMKNIVRTFIEELDNKYHHSTYVFYGKEINSDGSLIWKSVTPTVKIMALGQIVNAPPATNRRDRKEGKYLREFQLTSSHTPGDGTVPVESLEVIINNSTIKSTLATHVEHQNAYAVSDFHYANFSPAIKFTLRAIIKMVQEVSTPC